MDDGYHSQVRLREICSRQIIVVQKITTTRHSIIKIIVDTPSINILSGKTIYPLFNGGINRITISSDLLATSQYINSHKTATIAELQIGLSTNSQMNPMEISNSFDWKHEYFYFTMKKHEQHVPFIFASDQSPVSDCEYLPDILPDTFTSFHCNSGLLSSCFEIISIQTPSSGHRNIVSKPLDTKFRNRAGEL